MAKLSEREIDEGFEEAGEVPCPAELREEDMTPHEAAVESLRSDIENEYTNFGDAVACNDHGRLHGAVGCSACRNAMHSEIDILERVSKAFRFDVGVFNYGNFMLLDLMLAWLESNGEFWSEPEVNTFGIPDNKLTLWFKGPEHMALQNFKSALKKKGLIMKFDTIEIDPADRRNGKISCANTA
ncbi:hypothetical protein IPM19_01160 [bacterium]|nr:MAG: hypothetical protein IPM19_01160 [bacterium]